MHTGIGDLAPVGRVELVISLHDLAEQLGVIVVIEGRLQP